MSDTSLLARAGQLTAAQAKLVLAMSERELARNIADRARILGLLRYHTYRSERSPAGFPDEVIVGPAGVLFRELKRERGRLTAEQAQWLNALCSARQDAAVWRPSDLLAGVVDEQLAALAGRLP